MSDTAITIENNTDSSVHHTTSTNNIRLNQTRSFIWEFLLSFATFGSYSSFYFIFRTHEFNKLGKKRFTPWLWLFSLTPVISLFSLPALHTALNELEAEYRSPHSKKFNALIVILMLLSSTYLAISSSLHSPVWLDVLILTIFSVSFSLFAKRISTLKHAIPNVSWTKEHKIKIVLKWLFTVIFVPLYIIAIASELIDIYKYKDTPRLEKNTSISISQDQIASLSFFEDGWYQDEIGTYSDGSAEAEFSNINTSSYLMLFTYDEKFDLLDEHIHARRSWVENVLSQTKCHQDKYLLSGQLSVKVDLICSGQVNGEDQVGFVSVIETANKTYEILGMYAGSPYSFSQSSREITQMVREFKTQ
ncbi:hypothetical protein B6A42_12400 [Vibrio coralliilyticus]|uniref:hypothetical protein n=1 Tax=Vibrio coralliilyticus TaxID=190893 RepID=UPI0006CD2DEF|nr:hypothetical protein [Vibrio coralliilyticus]ARC92720.1 hypothetical protein B6A42_12400 [Vibrio coralliilyticus]AXN31129.1 hypothetical protein DVV14_07275 [Vibrio coralliilyticus]KPH27509.1 hypothetical protein ADU60_04425 [Vibrio coralliilyticus]